MNDFITIPYEEYRSLKQDSVVLQALKASGVANWEWYGAALEVLEDGVEPDLKAQPQGSPQRRGGSVNL